MSFVIAGDSLLLHPDLEQHSIGHSIRGKYNSVCSIDSLWCYLPMYCMLRYDVMYNVFKVYEMVMIWENNLEAIFDARWWSMALLTMKYGMVECRPTVKYGSVSFPRFNGMSDPHDHLLQYKHVVQSTNIPTGMFDDMMCKLFTQSLKGAALRWFCNLPPKSIDSFDELSLELMRSYSIHIQSGKTTKDLWGVIQGPHESLHAYIKRFSKAILEISGLDDGTARKDLKKGLRHKSLFKNEIYTRYPPTIQDALHRAKGFIELEEENERVDRDLVRTRKEVLRAREERGKPFIQLVAHLKRQDFVTWPKKLPENLARDMMKYCEFHRDHGHHTINCRALRAEVAELLKKGYLREFLTEKGRETYGLGNESKERRIVHSEATSLSRPHDDALVLTSNVSNCEVGQILINNGSSADVLFLSTLKEMELSESDIKSSTTVLTGFNGESTAAVGKIKLLVFAAGENKLTTFLILDCPSAYNIILGRP
ncbi:hypothetical protein TIFTF001_032049 [Ficus carica]|uniref:Retrotransposon gag domain-containing protein n=1 Tax=Ficus carica TaxID=3494 RepID=A0AA88DVQ3_FICCA|nr:hypothetical protein TIFTF001_032049 [Ficus carica]